MLMWVIPMALSPSPGTMMSLVLKTLLTTTVNTAAFKHLAYTTHPVSIKT